MMAAVPDMCKGMAGQPVNCTITGHCRTSIFEFPRSHLITEGLVDHQIIWSQNDCKAAIVADLPAYFEQESTNWIHYNIDVSLRAGVRRAYDKVKEPANRSSQPVVPLFLVIEQQEQVFPTDLSGGECFAVDEFRNGAEYIEGGRQGERALIAVRTCDGVWPTFTLNTQKVNVVLAAVRAEQKFIDSFEQLYCCSCYVSSDGQAVYGLGGSGTAILKSTARLDTPDLREKGGRIKSMLQRMMEDSERERGVEELKRKVSRLFDSLVLDKSKDDSYLQLWYLRLVEAIYKADEHLNVPQFRNKTKPIACKSAPVQFAKHRNAIAHGCADKIDTALLRDLRHTALELLRRKYRVPNDN